MKKNKVLTVLAVTLALGFSGSAYAASGNSSTIPQRLGLCKITAMRGLDYVTSILKNKLNLSDEAITKAISSGKTPYQIAEEKGMSQDQFRSAMIEEKSKAIDTAVSKGTITKDEANQIKAALKNNVQNCTGNFSNMRGSQFGRGQGRGFNNFGNTYFKN
jgi:ribosomal protein S20